MRLIKYGYRNPMEELVNNFLNQEKVNESQECYIPKTNILEEDEHYEIEIAAPGLKKKDINLNIDEDVLTVSSSRTEEDKKQYTIREFGAGNLERIFHLPEDVDQHDISAKLENGILTLVLPKKEEAKAIKKQIEIS